tara:strand:- start:1847 stop:2725 length:879 start_codon:yes stop_codon:yes gene_type:complete
MANIENLVFKDKFKCGYVATVGRPNVGKSSLINKIIGQPVSITSRRRQTTRDCILGVVTETNSQVIFVDTPGIESTGKHERNRKLNSLAISIFDDVDLILWVVEAKKINSEDKLISSLLPQHKPIVVAINKVDLVKSSVEKKLMFEQVEFFSNIRPKAIIPISVAKSFQISQLIDEIKLSLPVQEKIFDKNYITDKSVIFRSSEIIREKVFRLIGDELPYSVSVVIDRCSSKSKINIVEMDASILLEKNSHKPIVIGKNATRVKKIRIDSQRSLNKLFDAKVNLTIWVKVRK